MFCFSKKDFKTLLFFSDDSKAVTVGCARQPTVEMNVYQFCRASRFEVDGFFSRFVFFKNIRKSTPCFSQKKNQNQNPISNFETRKKHVIERFHQETPTFLEGSGIPIDQGATRIFRE